MSRQKSKFRRDPADTRFGPGALRGPRLEAWRDGGLPVAQMSAEEFDGLRRFGLKLLCPDHGVQVVVRASGSGPGQTFGLFCGCRRGRCLGPRTETEKSTAEVSVDSVGDDEPAEAEVVEAVPGEEEPAELVGDGG